LSASACSPAAAAAACRGIKTLQALIRWSYELLNSVEQQMLRRFSVFAGSNRPLLDRPPVVRRRRYRGNRRCSTS